MQVGKKECPRCGFFLNQELVKASARENFITAQAVGSANSIRLFNFGAYLLPAIALGRFIVDYSLHNNLVIIVVGLIPLAMIARWFIRFGNRDCDDIYFLEAKRRMKSISSLWLGANIWNWVTLLRFPGIAN